MTTAVSPSSWKASSHSHSNSRSSRPSTTPRANHPVMSVGQSRPPKLPSSSTTNARTPHTSSMIRESVASGSPSYFSFAAGDDSIPVDSGPGFYNRQNWNTSDGGSSSRSTAKHGSNHQNPEFELFRQQSEKNMSFALNNLSTPRSNQADSNPFDKSFNAQPSPRIPSFPSSAAAAAAAATPGTPYRATDKTSKANDNPFFLNAPQQDSPSSALPPKNTVVDHQHARLSLPATELHGPLKALQAKRSDTLPPNPSNDTTTQMLGPQQVAQIIEKSSSRTVLLDLRVYPQFAAARIRGALSLCIPTTLIKRPTFTVQKLSDTFTSEENKARFAKWRDAEYIIVYDANSSLAKEALTSFNVLKKFATEGWEGTGIVIKGGFAAFAKIMPDFVDKGGNNSSPSSISSKSSSGISLAPPNQEKLPVAGGCVMPETDNAANPFFSNIRQNMDLIDGVGQVSISRPTNMTPAEEKELPQWLKRAASISNEGKDVSDKFLGIERSEQQRMRKALSAKVVYGDATEQASKDVQVAGIEKGSKNRYNNIFPFEHSRVKLQGVGSCGCDYVNASHVKADYSNRQYIATQAPIPQTFEDFWRVIWEQDARVIVMLTAESEGGQAKAHTYWRSGDYGQLKVRCLSEKKLTLHAPESSSTTTATSSSPSATSSSALKRPPLGQRRSTVSNSSQPKETKTAELKKTATTMEEPFVIIRKISISHAAYPYQPLRDIVQLQYTQWPDFGAPTSPATVLSLIDLVNKYQKIACNYSHSSEEVPRGPKPIVVHCSAGCGRTGTFCTIDSVIDMLKQQRRSRREKERGRMDIDSKDGWMDRDDIDLVAKAVDDFRHQRLSMVQNLRQFVLCYESVLQWLHDERNASPAKK